MPASCSLTTSARDLIWRSSGENCRFYELLTNLLFALYACPYLMQVWANENCPLLAQRQTVMSVDQISAEELARLFHQYRRTLAPIFECEETAYTAEWDAAQPRERKLMIAIARLILSDLGSSCKSSRRQRETAAV